MRKLITAVAVAAFTSVAVAQAPTPERAAILGVYLGFIYAELTMACEETVHNHNCEEVAMDILPANNEQFLFSESLDGLSGDLTAINAMMEANGGVVNAQVVRYDQDVFIAPKPTQTGGKVVLWHFQDKDDSAKCLTESCLAI